MVQPLKFGEGLVISSHISLSMWLLIHAEIKLIHVSKSGSCNEASTRALKMQLVYTHVTPCAPTINLHVNCGWTFQFIYQIYTQQPIK